MSFISLHHVEKEYRLGRMSVRALKDVSLAVEAGEFVAIMGASGSGKSTLLHLIGGLDRPTAGRVRVGGDDLTALDERRLCAYRQRRVGFIFQKFHLLAAQTALENVEFPLLFAGAPEGERRARARRALDAVGLMDRAAHRPGELSGGQQQRVAIARALVNDPALLLADEPTGNLDSRTGLEIMALLSDLCRQGRTILLVTHDERLALGAHRIVHLQDGQLLASESASVDRKDHHAVTAPC